MQLRWKSIVTVSEQIMNRKNIQIWLPSDSALFGNRPNPSSVGLQMARSPFRREGGNAIASNRNFIPWNDDAAAEKIDRDDFWERREERHSGRLNNGNFGCFGREVAWHFSLTLRDIMHQTAEVTATVFARGVWGAVCPILWARCLEHPYNMCASEWKV